MSVVARGDTVPRRSTAAAELRTNPGIRYSAMLLYLFNRFTTDDTGATAVEYALLAGGGALAVIVGVGLMGGSVNDVLSDAGSGL
jgi:Flp pilus assembly pilin Flp